MQGMSRLITSSLPFIIIGGLLYAGLFVKPAPSGTVVAEPTFTRGDRLYGLAVMERGKAWAAGSDGKLVQTSDGGQSWHSMRSPASTTLQSIAVWDTSHAVVVGNDGLVMTTGDAGATWRRAEVSTGKHGSRLLRVKTRAKGDAWAVGEGGLILRSTDRGATWQSVGKAEDTAWNDVAIGDAQVLVVGEFGRIRRSADGGATWQDVVSPTKTSLMASAFRDERHGVAVGLNGVVLVTDDAGVSWSVARGEQAPLKSKPATLNDDPGSIYQQGRLEHLFDVLWDGKRWIAVGAVGMVLTAAPEALEWTGTRLTETDRNWYTSIASDGTNYYLSGSRVAVAPVNAL
jgi:photosystem II stability/assembly factor-like uncharacterized protein